MVLSLVKQQTMATMRRSIPGLGALLLLTIMIFIILDMITTMTTTTTITMTMTMETMTMMNSFQTVLITRK